MDSDSAARLTFADTGAATARSGPSRAAGEGILPPQALLDLWQADGETAPPVYLADAAGNLLYANAAYRRIAPYLREDAGAMSIDDVAASIDVLGRPLRQDLILKIDGRSECYMAERMVVRDGGNRPLAVMGRLIPAGELRRVEAALALAEDRLDDIARLMSDWIWETDDSLAFTFVSQRVLDHLGYHPREVLGRRLRDLTGNPGLFEQLAAREDRPPFRDMAVEIRRKSGVRRVFRLSGVAVFDQETGAFRGYRGIAQDVTEREAQYAALLKAVDDAEAANRAKTEFLANMSHELRTPLNAIMGFSEVMKLELMGPMGHRKYREYSEDILTSSRHLLNLINDILDVAKIEAGRLELDEKEIVPVELLAAVQRLVADSAARAGVALRVVGNPGLPRLLADERRLKQILLNLISNAVKFTPAGGSIAIEARRMRDGGLELAVSDTGVGIAPEEIAVAMAPFSQVDSGLARKFEGTGLGLPLSKALTELHGGSFLLESEVGVGTTVRVQLPPGRIVAG